MKTKKNIILLISLFIIASIKTDNIKQDNENNISDALQNTQQDKNKEIKEFVNSSLQNEERTRNIIDNLFLINEKYKTFTERQEVFHYINHCPNYNKFYYFEYNDLNTILKRNIDKNFWGAVYDNNKNIVINIVLNNIDKEPSSPIYVSFVYFSKDKKNSIKNIVYINHDNNYEFKTLYSPESLALSLEKDQKLIHLLNTYTSANQETKTAILKKINEFYENLNAIPSDLINNNTLKIINYLKKDSNSYRDFFNIFTQEIKE